MGGLARILTLGYAYGILTREGWRRWRMEPSTGRSGSSANITPIGCSTAGRNVPFDYAWGQLKQRSDAALSVTMSRYGGRPLRFVRTTFTGETTTYETFTVRRESEIIAADESGRELILRLYGSAMVRDGRYKLFSYVVD